MPPHELIHAAAAASKNAHAPYSNYQVGAALVTGNDTVFVGCNVENASYGLTNCAERTAIFSAVAAGQKEFKAIAIVAGSQPVPYPCGACRQVMAEFFPADAPVYIAARDDLDDIQETTVGALLPHSFKLNRE